MDRFSNYVNNLLSRFPLEYGAVIDELRTIVMELKALVEENRKRDEKRRAFQNDVFDVLIRCGLLPDPSNDDIPKVEEWLLKKQNMDVFGHNDYLQTELKDIDYNIQSGTKGMLNDLDKGPLSDCGEVEITDSRPLLSSGLHESIPSSSTKVIHAEDIGCGENGKAVNEVFSQVCYSELKLKDDKIFTANSRITKNASEAVGPINSSWLVDSEHVIDGKCKSSGEFKVGPFKLLYSMDVPQECAVVEYIFDENLEKNELIVDTQFNYLHRELFFSLKPGNDLSGEVINVISELMTESERVHSPKITKWFLTTRMSSLRMKDRNNLSEARRRKFCRNFFMGNFADCKKIFIPVHHLNHWLLLIIRVDENIVEIWDSLLVKGESMGRNRVHDIMLKLDMYLAFDIIAHKPEGWSFTKFNVITIKSAPQQNNSNDCGIYMISFMEERDFNILSYYSHDERARLVLKIVLSDCNNEKKRISEAALKYQILDGKECAAFRSKRKLFNIIV